MSDRFSKRNHHRGKHLPQTSQRRLARRRRQGLARRRAVHRSRHHARPDRQGQRSNGVKFDGVDLFLFAPHVDIDCVRRRPEEARGQGAVARSRDRLRRRAGLAAAPAAARPWASEAERKQVRRAGPQGLPDRQAAPRARRPALRRRPHRLGRPGPAIGSRTPKAIRRRSPPRSARPATSPQDYGERLAAEGEICWGGMHSWKRMVQLLELTDRPGIARLPGRHGPHAALHARLQRPGGSHPAGKAGTGRDPARSTRPWRR